MLRMLAHTIITSVRFLWFLVREVVRISVRLAAIALSSIWVGIPVASERMSEYWVDMARDAKVPEGLLKYVRYLGIVGAGVMIFLGWTIVALITVIALAALF